MQFKNIKKRISATYKKDAPPQCINGDFKPNLKNLVMFDDITKIIIYIFM